MNLFKKITKLLPKKQNKKEPNTIAFILHKLDSRKRNLNNRPKHLSEKEWLKILDIMIFAFSAKKNMRLKSQARRKMQYPRIDKGFKLFQKYIKDL